MSETQPRLSHRLSVVWFTDLVGYSTLAARNQDRAVALVQRFQEIVERTIPCEEGRVVKFIGDAALLESPSAESALQAATALHREIGDGLRTGIHPGAAGRGTPSLARRRVESRTGRGESSGPTRRDLGAAQNDRVTALSGQAGDHLREVAAPSAP